MKLKATLETSVYVSKGGYLCIKQPAHYGCDDAVRIGGPTSKTSKTSKVKPPAA